MSDEKKKDYRVVSNNQVLIDAREKRIVLSEVIMLPVFVFVGFAVIGLFVIGVNPLKIMNVTSYFVRLKVIGVLSLSIFIAYQVFKSAMRPKPATTVLRGRELVDDESELKKISMEECLLELKNNGKENK
nr:hypothetical protein [uncultured Pseudogulbenkiania sp.]